MGSVTWFQKYWTRISDAMIAQEWYSGKYKGLVQIGLSREEVRIDELCENKSNTIFNFCKSFE